MVVTLDTREKERPFLLSSSTVGLTNQSSDLCKIYLPNNCFYNSNVSVVDNVIILFYCFHRIIDNN